MAYMRSSYRKWLLSAQNISINLVLPFIFNSEGKLWDCRLNKGSLGGRGNIRGGSYIPETRFVGWAFLNGQHASQLFINDSF
jgi:hypothetical protein